MCPTNIEEVHDWVSIRAQTLSRTVKNRFGMMYYEQFLSLLANLEQFNEDTTDNVLSEKFGYIALCQVYEI